ncbi:PRC-barrel domain-containing protein [Fulvimarina endophytica]|nr:PRC-barrel domain-containing protein [Fulvimarina endophytica]
MLRRLLVSTALAGVLATGAYAQDANQNATQAPEAAQTEQGMDGQAATSADASAQQGMQGSGNFLQNLSSDQYLASNLNGKSIYASDAQDAEAVATIDNFLLDADGQIVAAIVTTEGEESKQVAVPFDQIQWTMMDGEPRATMASGGQDLAAMPAFQMPDEQNAQASGSATGEQAAGGTAGGDMATGGATTGGDMAASGSATGGDMAASGSAASTDSAATAQSDMAASGSSDAPTMVGENQYLSQNIIGSNVVTGTGQDAETLGSVNNLVVSSSGEIVAGVVGVGGFLGIGEKDVAVPFDDLTFNREEDGTPQIVYASNREQLEAAPSFDDERPQDGQQSSDMSGSAATGTAAATGAAAGAAAGSAVDQTSQAADQAATEVGQAADQAGNSMKQAGDQAAQSAENAAQSTENAAENATGNTDAAGTTAAAGAAGSQEGMEPVSDTSTLTADDLIGSSVVGPNNETVADVSDIVLSPDGQVDAIIVDVGGFLGIGAKPVEMKLDELNIMRDSGGDLTVQSNMTQEQLESAPEYQAPEEGNQQQSN